MNKKKKILLMSDDLRQHSGIATMSRELVLGCIGKYDWVQIGGSIKHPEKGKVMDLSESIKKETGVEDAYAKIYPVDGYGDPSILKQVIMMEKPDAILHFTDPRFWYWLYQMERELRIMMPLCYYNIWDDLPYPMYNRSFYESCDALFGISKQTVNINKQVLGRNKWLSLEELLEQKNLKGKSLCHYVPHGINPKIFKPLDTEEEIKKTEEFKKQVFKEREYDFIVFYNNRNIHRKHVSDVVLAYRIFCDHLPKEKSKKCCLLLHTQPKDDNGTDLIAAKEAVCPNYDMVFSAGKVDSKSLSAIYNMVDVTIQAGSNEGFGLSSAESIMCGTPIIVNVTGGLQDQIGQTDENGKPVEFTEEWGTNEEGRYKNHGVWVKAVWPTNRSLQGSCPTPYIIDGRCSFEDLADAMMFWYKIPKEDRRRAGQEGRRWAMNEGGLNSENMSNQLINGMEAVFQYWKPREKYDLIECSSDFSIHKMEHLGIGIRKIDEQKIKEDIIKFKEKLNKL